MQFLKGSKLIQVEYFCGFINFRRMLRQQFKYLIFLIKQYVVKEGPGFCPSYKLYRFPVSFYQDKSIGEGIALRKMLHRVAVMVNNNKPTTLKYFLKECSY